MKPFLTLTLAATLGLATPALATPAQEMELRSLGQCALASNLYKSLMAPGVPVTPTEADKALYAKIQAANPALGARAEQLAMAVGMETSGAIRTKLMAELKAQLEPIGAPKLAPRAALDRYAPIVEACVVRSQLLSGTAPAPVEPEAK